MPDFELIAVNVGNTRTRFGLFREGRLEQSEALGKDRLHNAMGAYSRAEQACIVIDAVTAVTVDFVDGEGTYHGGAIAPGLYMMLGALHDRTAALPAVGFEAIGPGEAFGKDTRRAMLLGVQSA